MPWQPAYWCGQPGPSWRRTSSSDADSLASGALERLLVRLPTGGLHNYRGSMVDPADPRVDAYIDALPDWQQAICREVRDLVHAADPEVTETIKRTNRPYFVLQGNPSSPCWRRRTMSTSSSMTAPIGPRSRGNHHRAARQRHSPHGSHPPGRHHQRARPHSHVQKHHC